MTEASIGKCGSSCTDCTIYHITQEKDPQRAQEMAALWSGQFDRQLGLDDVWCDGCTGDGRRCFQCASCAIHACAVERGAETCAHCSGYPCERLTVFFQIDPAARTRLDGLRATVPAEALRGPAAAAPAPRMELPPLRYQTRGDLEGLDLESRSLILQTLKDLGRDLMTPEKCLEWDAADVFPEEVLRTLIGPEVGMHLVFIPEECGGLGGGARDIYRVSEALARIDLGIATAFSAIALGSDPIRVGATEEQRRRWLGKIAEEGLLVGYGVTEPEAGSNVAALKTKAEPVTEGDQVVAYRLTGTKQFITNGGVADLYTVLAAAPGGPSFFVVERGAEGLEVGPHEIKHGIRASNTSQVILEDVHVPADQLIGLVEGRGLMQANEVFGFTRLMVAAFGLGGGVEAISRAIAYSKERKQFNRPLCRFKGYTHKLLLPHVVRLEAARSYIEEVAHRLDSGEPGLQTEGAIAKLFATETGNAAAEAAIQAHGGYGYVHEYFVEKIKRDVRITTIYEGTSEILQNIIFTYRTQQLKGGAFFSDAAADVRQLGPDVAADLVTQAAAALGALLAFRQLETSREQHLMFELADRIAEVEHALAFCRRASQGRPELKAACRVFATEVASRLATSTVTVLSAGDVPEGARTDFLQTIGFERMLWNRAGLAQDQDLVIEWALSDEWPG